LPVIEQAKGILMAQSGCTAQERFDALSRISQQENIKVREVAARLLASTRLAAGTRAAG
jgi:AmiR/NasT family two-component response regulator